MTLHREQEQGVIKAVQEASGKMKAVTVTKVSRLIALWAKTMGRTEVEMNTLQVFMIVAETGGRAVPQSSIRDRVGLSEAATSRNIALLSTGATPTSKSPRLIESFEDPEYRRRKLVRLTAKGTQLLATIQDILENGGEVALP